MKFDSRLLLILALWPLAGQSQPEVREIPTRSGVTVRFIYAKAENPVASAVLLQGGSGAIGIFPNGTTQNSGFLATGAERFAGNGVSVVIPDVPSDRNHLHDFRTTPEHAQDIAALIAFLRQQGQRHALRRRPPSVSRHRSRCHEIDFRLDQAQPARQMRLAAGR